MRNFVFVSFQDQAYEEQVNSSGALEYTGRVKKRMVLVLDCLVAHEFSPKTADLMNLQHYVIREKKLSEKEAIIIFLDIVRIVESLHKVCHCHVWSDSSRQFAETFKIISEYFPCIQMFVDFKIEVRLAKFKSWHYKYDQY